MPVLVVLLPNDDADLIRLDQFTYSHGDLLTVVSISPIDYSVPMWRAVRRRTRIRDPNVAILKNPHAYREGDGRIHLSHVDFPGDLKCWRRACKST